MKKWRFIFCQYFIFVSGCSLLNDVNTTITYIDEATGYFTKATDFANEVKPLAQQAVEDVQAAEELETRLQDMKQDIETFNELQAPGLAADLHQQIVEKNNAILDGIDLYLNNIVDGKLDPAILENTELFQTVQDISSIIEQIKSLGN